MAVDTGARSQQARFDELMQAGRKALESGDRRLAHDRWREAAMIDPYDENVWMALLRVLDDEEDRRVCLENIIAINPMNVQARRILHRQSPEAAAGTQAPRNPATESVTEPKSPAARSKRATASQARAQKTTSTQARAQKTTTDDLRASVRPKAKPRTSIGRLILMVIVALVLAVVLGLVVSVVVFGRH